MYDINTKGDVSFTEEFQTFVEESASVCPNVNHISRFYPFQSVHLTKKQSKRAHNEEEKGIFERVVKTVVEYGNKEFPEEKEDEASTGYFHIVLSTRKLQERDKFEGSFCFNPRFTKDKSGFFLFKKKQRIIQRLFPYRSIDRRSSQRKREEEIQGRSSR